MAPVKTPPPVKRFLTLKRCPRCYRREASILCHACGTFKFPKVVEPFAEKDAA